MLVEFAGGIAVASGTLCKNRNGWRIIVTTRKAPSVNKGKMRMYLRSAKCYERTTPPSDAEKAARDLFSKRQAYVRELMDSGRCRTKAQAWKIAKERIL